MRQARKFENHVLPTQAQPPNDSMWEHPLDHRDEASAEHNATSRMVLQAHVRQRSTCRCCGHRHRKLGDNSKLDPDGHTFRLGRTHMPSHMSESTSSN